MSLLSQFFPSGGGSGAETLNTGGFTIDFLLVGGGGGGGSLNPCAFPSACITPNVGIFPATAAGGGGGGGKVFQVLGANVQTGVEYPIVIGAGGAANTSGSASRFADFIAGGGGYGGGDPNNGIAAYYYLASTPALGGAGGDANYCDPALLCLTAPNLAPLAPCYSDPVLINKHSGKSVSIDCNGISIQSSLYGRAVINTESALNPSTQGNIFNPTISLTPRTPLNPNAAFNCTGSGAAAGYYCTQFFTGSLCCNSYLEPSCICYNAPSGSYCAQNLENEIFKKNNIAEVNCIFSRGGGGGGTFRCFVPNFYTGNCQFIFDTGGDCSYGVQESVWRRKLDEPSNSGSLPTYTFFNRQLASVVCGTKGLPIYKQYAALFTGTNPIARGAHGEFLPVSNAKMRFAMASGYYGTAGPLFNAYSYQVCVCQGNVKFAGTVLIDMGPRAGCEYLPFVTTPTCLINGCPYISYQNIGLADNIDYAYVAITCYNSAYIPGVCSPTICSYSCTFVQPGYAFTPSSYQQSPFSATRLFTCAGSQDSWASPTGPGSSCLNLPASNAVIADLVTGTPHIQSICWRAAESGIAGTGSGGGGGVRSQGHCNACDNVFFRYGVTCVPFSPAPVLPSCFQSRWLCCFAGSVDNFSGNFPICGPTGMPTGVKCLQICIPCTTPTTLAGGNGGSGALWIVYPADLPAATVTGNTPVASPPSVRVYYWEGNGTIKFNQ